MAVTYAFDFVLANFGIAIAAKMPMMTTTISSSMSVKPLRARSMLVMGQFLRTNGIALSRSLRGGERDDPCPKGNARARWSQIMQPVAIVALREIEWLPIRLSWGAICMISLAFRKAGTFKD